MNLQSIIFFYGLFFLVMIIGISIYVKITNNKSRPKIINFIKQTDYLKPIIFKDIAIKHLDSNHYKTRSSPNGKCDLYIFDNFLAILRKQKFILKIEFEPLILSSNYSIKNRLNLNNSHFRIIDKVIFTKYKNDELILKYNDEKFTHYKTEIILRKLTSEQIDKLKHIEKWETKLT